MILDSVTLKQTAAKTGFSTDTLEKVLRLLGLLETLFSHPDTKGKLALKGGTAINLFVYDAPRLSVDLDFNYIGSVSRDTMLRERSMVEKAIDATCRRESVSVQHRAKEHAGGKWRLRYNSLLGRSGNLELDLEEWGTVLRRLKVQPVVFGPPPWEEAAKSSSWTWASPST